MIPRHSSEAYVCSMEDSAVPADRSPKCTVLGCSQPASASMSLHEPDVLVRALGS